MGTSARRSDEPRKAREARHRVAVAGLICTGVLVGLSACGTAQDGTSTASSARAEQGAATEQAPAVPTPGTPAPKAAAASTGEHATAGDEPAPTDGGVAVPVSPDGEAFTKASADTEVTEEVVAAALEVPALLDPESEDSLDTTVADDLAAVAAGPMRAELEAELLEMATQGWSRLGDPDITSVAIVDGAANSDRIVAQACVDWSHVSYIDANGNAVASNPTPRALQLFTLTRNDDGRWVVFSRELPDNPRC